MKTSKLDLFLKKFDLFFKLDYSKGEKIWLTSSYTLRLLVGAFGMALPILLWLSLYLFTGHCNPLNSICHYYFTRVASIYIMTVTMIIIYLILYQGKENKDFYISTIAGLSAILYLLFPTSNISNICNDPDKIYSVTILPCSQTRVLVHNISALIFLLTLAGMACCLFTKSHTPPKDRTPKKKLRNRIYRTCGVIILISTIIIILGEEGCIQSAFYKEHHMTFWMEAIAIESFGFSWLIKGRPFSKIK
jgi:hypothetical protein